MAFWEKVELTLHGDQRGSLVSIEKQNGLPFDVRRVYYIFGTQSGVRRGFHAHKCLDQLLIAVSGSCKVLVDDGRRKEEVVLDTPLRGLRIKDLVWREMFDFSPDCVLMVLASQPYDESDYIRNYEAFLKATQQDQ